MKKARAINSVLTLGLAGCVAGPQPIVHPDVPSLRFSENVKRDMGIPRNPNVGVHVGQFQSVQGTAPAALPVSTAGSRAQLRYAADGAGPVEMPPADQGAAASDPGYTVYRSSSPDIRDYNGPLSLGDPGVTASLWQEGRGTNDLFRDYRAFQPLDLVTIVVSEVSEGTKEADTESSTESSILHGISAFFGFEDDAIQSNSKDRGTADTSDDFIFDPSQLIKADSQNEFEGEAETTRKGSLTARISAMVVEVLPGGIMRIEGEKIIAVNNEEQIMVISGLVRPRDVTSENEVDSAKIANLRIDYFGKGTLGDAQVGGWFGGLLRQLWPF